MTESMSIVECMARAMWEQRREFNFELPIPLEEWGDGSLPRANGVVEEARAALKAFSDKTGIYVKVAA